MTDDEQYYNDRIIDNLDNSDYVETDENNSSGQFYGNDLTFEMQIRNPKSEENFPHLNRDISGAFFDKWDKASVHENLLFLRNVTVLYNMGFEELESTISTAIGRVAEIGVVSQGVDGNLQKTRITRVINRSSRSQEERGSRFRLFNRGGQ